MEHIIFENVEIIDAGSEGKAVARVNDKVIFVPFVVPGDIIDIRVIKKKKSYFEGVAVRFHKYSSKRTEAFCEHFGTCGGCKWQNMKYDQQLFYKQKQVEDNLVRIGKIPNPPMSPILPSEMIKYYRNKLEYTFSNRRWLTADDNNENGVPPEDMNALGFHIPGLFDKVLDIKNCYLQPDPSNAIRLEARKYALERGLAFYDVRAWTGFLRNILIRNTPQGDLMVIVVFRNDDETEIPLFMDNLIQKFPSITSLYYVINDKKNDVINDLPFHLYKGDPFITETMQSLKGDKNIRFRIGPSSFFQTNSVQAVQLYRLAGEFAGFRGTEHVYDLYTGIGSIANYIASSVRKVTGIESVPTAIEDAKSNSRLNGITNTSFFAGEAEKLLSEYFFRTHGYPDVIITDPPRAGMHEKVIRLMMEAAPEKIVYISCNPATQARDLLLMSPAYRLEKCQPVDMFPHTHHVENVALLTKTDQA